MNENNVIMVSLNARLQPMHRHGLEDLIDDLLEEKAIGYTCGGGTLLGEDGEISGSDIEITLNDVSPKTIDDVIHMFSSILAPKGSKIILVNQTINFGTQEGLALYLNGQDLPDEVYETSDINALWDDIMNNLGDDGKIHSFSELHNKTVFYLYGDSFEIMRQLIYPITSTHPLCQKCQIIQIA